ncbi:sensor domain-containing diguanylate cyclase/phosphohydrolase [Desulfoplanes sp. PS50]
MATFELQKKFMESRKIHSSGSSAPAISFAPDSLNLVTNTCASFFQSIFENATYGMFQSTPEGKFLQVNPAFARILGYETPQELLSTIDNIENQFFLKPEDRNIFKKVLAEQGRIDNYEYLARRRDGSTAWMTESAWACRDDNGQITHYEGILWDISRQKHVEARLETALDRLDMAMQAAELGFWDWDVQSGEMAVNEKWAQILGYSLAEIEPISVSTWERLCHPKDRKKVFTLLEEYFHRGHEQFETEYRMKHKNGSWVWVAARGKIVAYDTAGKPVRITGTVSDISIRRQREAQLRYLSFHDQLTGLYNRTYFENEMTRLQKSRDFPISIICCDVDGLKLINDTLGHHHGDLLLQTCAQTLQTCLRDSDILTRVGGDEFVALLPRTGPADGKAIVERINKGVAAYRTSHPEKPPVHISVGLATAMDANAFLEETFKKADDQMYHRKQRSKDTIRSRLVTYFMDRLNQLHALSQKRIQWIENICADMGRKAGLTAYQIAKLTVLVRVHDLGMISAPKYVVRSSLNQPLSKEDWDILRHHTYKGQSIALTCRDLEDVADLIFLHHEQWDGKGYPLGRSGEDIPIECRIMDIVKSFDNLTNPHLTGNALSKNKALEEIRKSSGSRFDPLLVQLFLQILKKPASQLP